MFESNKNNLYGFLMDSCFNLYGFFMDRNN